MVRLIELLVIRGRSEVAFVVCVVDGDSRVLVWLVLVREFRKERKMGEIVGVSVSTWYRGPNNSI